MSAPVTTAISPRRTRPSNATAHPGAIVLGAKVKRRTKSQVQADNKRVEEEEKTRKRAKMEGVERLTAIEMDMEEKATELASKKMKPVRPARKGKVAEDARILASKTAGDINVDSHPDESTKKPTDGIQLSKISLKDVVAHAKAEMMRGQRKEKNVPISVKSTCVVPDGKTSQSSKKLASSTQVRSWIADMVDSSNNAATGGSKSSPSSYRDTPPSTVLTSAVSKDTAHMEVTSIISDSEDDTCSYRYRIVDNADLGFEVMAAGESDDEFTPGLSPPFTQVPRVSSGVGKRKAEEVDPVSDSEPEMFRAADDKRSSRGASEVMSADSADVDDAVLAEKSSMKKERETSVGITRSSIPLSKKVKLEVAGDLDNKVSVSQGPHKTKPRSKYSNSDLPVPVDYRWMNRFLDTVTLWAGSQPNIWTIPEDTMVTTFQAIFNAVYPDVVYTVKNHGSQAVFAVIDEQPHDEVASQLLEDYIFIREDMDEPNHARNFHSHFILQLVANAHLSKVSDALDIPALHTQELLEGYQMDSVIALATAALKHAFSFVRDDIINVKSIIEHMEMNGGKLEIRLPKTLNKATGRETSGPYMFSVSNWGEETASYKISIASRGDENTIDVIASAQTLLKKSTAPQASVGAPADVNRHALL
ncbi:hypothetical protein PISMIDRAFT_10964 [Pisolithus microcarpus 441]|uniref:Unplaced genomic scaffold scaffold_43, whole genome shotgun sequence n=1 Tax=Pisolithus microcarpus 441 TaxID=765257 RepID=A0A0C9Z2R1_9AGAM|nr:hypothetical protein BKA83DRAFT_10964 [Pisolithus microcarpus]KIK23316.1 hypothetical protein PISMIDRAFT_10964 [Pisolithus microcarpus 441]